MGYHYGKLAGQGEEADPPPDMKDDPEFQQGYADGFGDATRATQPDETS